MQRTPSDPSISQRQSTSPHHNLPDCQVGPKKLHRTFLMRQRSRKPCLRRLARRFASSHSNFIVTPNVVTPQREEKVCIAFEPTSFCDEPHALFLFWRQLFRNGTTHGLQSHPSKLENGTFASGCCH